MRTTIELPTLDGLVALQVDEIRLIQIIQTAADALEYLRESGDDGPTFRIDPPHETHEPPAPVALTPADVVRRWLLSDAVDASFGPAEKPRRLASAALASSSYDHAVSSVWRDGASPESVRNHAARLNRIIEPLLGVRLSVDKRSGSVGYEVANLRIFKKISENAQA